MLTLRITEKELTTTHTFYKELEFKINQSRKLVFTNLPNSEFYIFEPNELSFEGKFTEKFEIIYNSEIKVFEVRMRDSDCSFVIHLNRKDLKELVKSIVIYETEFEIV